MPENFYEGWERIIQSAKNVPGLSIIRYFYPTGRKTAQERDWMFLSDDQLGRSADLDIYYTMRVITRDGTYIPVA